MFQIVEFMGHAGIGVRTCVLYEYGTNAAPSILIMIETIVRQPDKHSDKPLWIFYYFRAEIRNVLS